KLPRVLSGEWGSGYLGEETVSFEEAKDRVDHTDTNEQQPACSPRGRRGKPTLLSRLFVSRTHKRRRIEKKTARARSCRWAPTKRKFEFLAGWYGGWIGM